MVKYIKKKRSGYLLKIKQEEKHDAVTLIFCAGTNCSWVHIPHFKVFKWREKAHRRRPMAYLPIRLLDRRIFALFFILFHGIKRTSIKALSVVYLWNRTYVERILSGLLKSITANGFWLKMLNSIFWCDLDVSFGTVHRWFEAVSMAGWFHFNWPRNEKRGTSFFF